MHEGKDGVGGRGEGFPLPPSLLLHPRHGNQRINVGRNISLKKLILSNLIISPNVFTTKTNTCRFPYPVACFGSIFFACCV